MPELPEVETVVRALRHRVAGRRLSHLRIWQPGIIESDLNVFRRRATGVRVIGVRRRGKWIVIDLDTGDTILAHLRMTGSFAIVDAGTPRHKHEHLEWRLDNGTRRLRFRDLRRFGRLRLLPTPEVESYLTGLGWGPEPFEITAAAFARRLGRGKRSIKAALLDQRLVAGLGNIYADEVLFAAGIDPRTPAARVGPTRAARIHAAMQAILTRAIDAQGTTLRNFITLDGSPGSYRRQLKVFNREAEACPNCGRPIRRIKLVGRSTHFCGHCQRR